MGPVMFVRLVDGVYQATHVTPVRHPISLIWAASREASLASKHLVDLNGFAGIRVCVARQFTRQRETERRTRQGENISRNMLNQFPFLKEFG